MFQSETTQIDVPNADHFYFYTKANDEWFMSNLIEQLQVPNQAQPETFMQ